MKFTAKPRSVQGSSASRRLRRAGRVPAIVYGGRASAVNIELDHNEIFHSLNREGFHSSILDMDLEGRVEPVLIRSVQWHPYKPLVLHVDFQRVDITQALTTSVPVHYLNSENCPAVKISGQEVIHGPAELEITCLPADLPRFIAVELGALEADGRVYLEDIALPDGVTYVPRGEDTNPLLAQAVEPRISRDDDELADEADEAASEADQPEAESGEGEAGDAS